MRNENVLVIMQITKSYMLKKNANFISNLKNIITNLINLVFVINNLITKNIINAYNKNFIIDIKNI